MARLSHIILLTAAISLLLLSPAASLAQSEQRTVRGKIYDAETQTPIPGASIALAGGTLSTISNSQGEFRLVLPQQTATRIAIRVSHIGYQSQIKEITLSTATLANMVDFPMLQAHRPLQAALIVGGDATDILRKAIARVKKNYPDHEEALVGFYRESIRRGGNYVSLVECVLGINKASYASRRPDHAQLHVGRKGTHLKPQDTIVLQYQGGISASLLLDVAKNPYILFDDLQNSFRFLRVGQATIDERPQHIIHFEPAIREFSELQYSGQIYIDTASLAIRSVHFNLLIEDGSPAARILIRRRPTKVKIKDIAAQYEVEYRADNDTIRLAYTKLSLEFTCKRRFSLFSRKYTITSELAITGRSNLPVRPIPKADRISSSDLLTQRVEHFQDPVFWDEYTTIEPDESLREAVAKFARRMRRF